MGGQQKKKKVNDRSIKVNVENIGRKHKMYKMMNRPTLQKQRTMNKRHQHTQLQLPSLQLLHSDKHVYLWEKQTKGKIGKGTEIELYKHIQISSRHELSQRQEK